MKELKKTIIDSHIHIENIYENKSEQILWMKDNNYIPISWSFTNDISNIDDFKKYLQKQLDIIENLNNIKLESYFLTGIHPRNIFPEINIFELEDIIMPFINNDFCLGLGEIGLENGDKLETDVFCRQLEMAYKIRQKGKKIGIHTPRNNKEKITKKILNILSDFSSLSDLIVIDHCTINTIEWVLEKGYYAGITLSPIKTSFLELKNIINQYNKYLNKIMCNTDSGSDLYLDLYNFYCSDICNDIEKNMLCFENAFNFFIKVISEKVYTK